MRQNRRLRSRDPVFLEKCILAFELVARLAEAGLDFVFKGGTCLLLHVQPTRRLSTDVDIATGASLDELSRVLGAVTQTPPFDRSFIYREDRIRENPPTRYFDIPFAPVTGRKRETDTIQLDVLVSAGHYPATERKALALDFIEVEREVSVTVPTVDTLMGDKLTAFAPTTVGLLYQPVPRRPDDPPPVPRPLGVLKQMFDVGVLFEHATDLRAVAAAYDHCFRIQQEARRRTHPCTREQALDDTLDASAHIAALALKDIDNAKTAFFRDGVRILNNHLVGGTFTTTTAQIHAARAALVAALLKSGRTDLPMEALRPVPPAADIAPLNLPAPWERYARLKKLSPEAFYRWYQAARL